MTNSSKILAEKLLISAIHNPNININTTGSSSLVRNIIRIAEEFENQTQNIPQTINKY